MGTNMLTDILIGLALSQGLLLLIPPIVIKVGSDNWLLKKRGATALNNPFGVLIDKSQKHYHPVLAQELYECETRKNLFRLVLSITSKKESRRIEATGQTTTVLLMCQMDKSLNEYDELRKRAEFMTRKYKHFEFFSVDDVITLMNSYREEAQKQADWYLDEKGYTML